MLLCLKLKYTHRAEMTTPFWLDICDREEEREKKAGRQRGERMGLSTFNAPGSRLLAPSFKGVGHM